MDVWPLPRISFRELASVEETRPVALITHQIAWSVVNKKIELPLVIQAEPTRNDRDFFEYLAANLPSSVQVIYAVGEDLAIDAGKYVASESKKPLVIIPTALSSDAAFTPLVTVWDKNQPTSLATGSAEEVVLDMAMLKNGPIYHRTAAITEVLSIVTALRDWSYAEQKGKTTPETKLVPWATTISATVAAQALKNAAALGSGDADALRTLVDLTCIMVQMDSQLGHRRASQGVEHIFAHAVHADPKILHAEKVGAGILIAAALYKMDTLSLRGALEAAGVRLGRLENADIRAAVNALPDEAKAQNAPYGILSELKSSSDELADALTKSTLIDH